MGILYWYYTTHRPPAPGAIPSGAVECESYDTRTYIPNIDDQAWGKAAYNHPLTDEQVSDYELVPEPIKNGKKEPWILFYAPDGTELMAYTLRGTFFGELGATIELIAYEHGLQPSDITFAQVTR